MGRKEAGITSAQWGTTACRIGLARGTSPQLWASQHNRTVLGAADLGLGGALGVNRIDAWLTRR